MIKVMLVCLFLNSVVYSNEVLNNLIPILIQVESNGNDKAVGDNGKAFGCLQIWNICVEDVNRIYKTNYTHEMMLNRYSSVEVATLYLDYYGKHYTSKMNKEPTSEIYAKMHNGGPRGYKNTNTKKYWKKVQEVAKSLNIKL